MRITRYRQQIYDNAGKQKSIFFLQLTWIEIQQKCKTVYIITKIPAPFNDHIFILCLISMRLIIIYALYKQITTT